MASIGPVGGGAGGSATVDGTEGCGANASFLKNTPVEIIEAEVPIRCADTAWRRIPAAPASFAAAGTLMEFQVFAPNSVITARNRDRCRFAAWGVRGGEAASSSRFTRNPGQDGEQELGNADIVELEPGDILRVQGPGGGGYGAPCERDVARVLEDVRGSFVSRESARARYGVVIDDGGVDLPATNALRGRMRQRPERPAFRSRARAGRVRGCHDARPLRRPDAHPGGDPGELALLPETPHPRRAAQGRATSRWRRRDRRRLRGDPAALPGACGGRARMSDPALRYEFGIDIGGTFTDIVCRADDGAIRLAKIPTTRGEPEPCGAGGAAHGAARLGVAPQRRHPLRARHDGRHQRGAGAQGRARSA